MDDRNKQNNDAYSDLLDAYASEEKPKQQSSDLHGVVERHTSSAKPQFKVEIKNLDEEFHETRKKTLSPQEQRKKQGTYYQTQGREPLRHTQPKKKPAAKQNENKSNPNGLTYDEDFGPIITRGPKKQQAPVRRPVGEEPQVKTALQEHAVIMKRGNPNSEQTAKLTGNKIADFFIQNKKTWMIVVVCVVCASLISSYLISCMNDILAIRRDSETVVTVTIPADTDTKSAIDILLIMTLLSIEYSVKCLRAL